MFRNVCSKRMKIMKFNYKTMIVLTILTSLGGVEGQNEASTFNENSWATSGLLGIGFFLIIAGSIAGNIIVMCAIKMTKSLQCRANYLISSLALTDLLVACLVMPFSAVYEVTKLWTMGDIFCQLWTAIDIACCTASILHLCAIAVERHNSVANAIKYFTQRKKDRIYPTVTLIWFLAFGISTPPLLGWKPETKNFPKSYNFTVGHRKCEVSQHPGYTVYATFGSFYIPLVLLLIVYCRIYSEIRKQIQRSESRSKLSANSTEDWAGNLSVLRHLSPTNKNNTKLKQKQRINKSNAIFLPAKNWRTETKAEGKDTPMRCISVNEGQCKRYTMIRNRVISRSADSSPVLLQPMLRNSSDYIASNSLNFKEDEKLFDRFRTPSPSPIFHRNNPPFSRSASARHSLSTQGDCQNTKFHSQQLGRYLNALSAETWSLESSLSVQSINSKRERFNTSSFNSRRTFDYHSRNLPRYSKCSSLLSNFSIRSQLRRVRLSANPEMKFSRSVRAKIKCLKAREIRAIRTLGTIVGAFVVCWLPFFVITLIKPFCNCVIPNWLNSLVLWMGYCNSLINPIIYTLFNRDYYRAIKKILTRKNNVVCVLPCQK